MNLPATLLFIWATLAATSATAEIKPQDAILSDYPYPYPVKQFTLKAQQQPLTMAYMDIAPAKGKKAKGTVLLLHGKNFSGAYWKDTIAALSNDGFRVIAPDQIGFGKSSKPLKFQYSFHALADATRALLDQLNIGKVSVAGHSMGGMLASRFTLMYPERVEKLIMINPIGLEDYKRFIPYLPLDQARAKEEAQTPETVKRYMTRAYFDGKWHPDYDPLLDIQAGWTIGPDANTIATIDALTADMIFTQPVLYEFPDIKAPTLLIIGTRDRTAIGIDRAPKALRGELGRYDRLGKITAQAIPNATLVTLEGVGHVPIYEAFDRYISAFLEFLQQ